MKLPGQELVETILEDVKDMQGDLNSRLDTIAALLEKVIENQEKQINIGLADSGLLFKE